MNSCCSQSSVNSDISVRSKKQPHQDRDRWTKLENTDRQYYAVHVRYVSWYSSTTRCETCVDNVSWISRWPCQVVFDVDNTNTGDEVTLEGHSNEQSQDDEVSLHLGVLVSDFKIGDGAVTTSGEITREVNERKF